MSWVIIAIIGYFFLALANVNDKVFLEHTVKDSRVYTWFIGVLGMIVLALLPLGFTLPSFSQIIISLGTGFLFIGGLLALYRALKVGEASWVLPLIGAIVPLVSLALGWIWLGEALDGSQGFAFLLLVLGGVILSRGEGSVVFRRGAGIALIAAVLFGVSSVASKYIFSHQGFVSGFVLIRVGSFLAVLCLLLMQDIRDAIRSTWRELALQRKMLFAGNQIFAALGFVAQNWAFALGNVALVNALLGVQFIFVMVIVIVLSRRFPNLLRERLSRKVIIEKVMAIVIIGAGLLLLAV